MESVFYCNMSSLPKDIEEAKVLILGLEDSGKSKIFYKLVWGQDVETVPTTGFNVDTVTYKTIKFTFWDLSGNPNIVLLWPHYYDKVDGIVYVLDSRDVKMEQVSENLNRVLSEESINRIPLLVFANKRDLCDPINVPGISDKLGLHNIINRNWFVQPTCALTGEGIYEGLDWLCNNFLDLNDTDSALSEVLQTLIKFFLRLVENVKNYVLKLWKAKHFKTIKALILGPENSGKTVILYQLVLQEFFATAPTIGLTVETMEYKNIKFKLHDVGRSQKLGSLAKNYYEGTNLLIYVVDSTDKAVQEKGEILKTILSASEMSNVALLVLANKKDSIYPMTTQEITEKMNLDQINNIKWHIQQTCGLTGEGIREGIDWFYRTYNN